MLFVRALGAGVLVAGAIAAAAQTPPSPKPAAQRLPYAAVHDPEFIKPADAAFLHDQDRVIGVTVGRTAKAYPAAILSQHGLVEDKGPSGPIAVTW